MAQEFWWNWFVQLGVAVGTIGAVGVALWSAFRQTKRPVLMMKVLREEGELTELNTGEPVQMFHIEVSNAQRDVVATRVQVYLSALAIVRDEKIEEVWRGDIPLRRRDQGVCSQVSKARWRQTLRPFSRQGEWHYSDGAICAERLGKTHKLPGEMHTGTFPPGTIEPG